MKMNMIAFKDLGTIVKDPGQFVGRKTEMNSLTEGIYHNQLIVGLPRIGKSSLAYQALLKASEQWKLIHSTPFVWIWFDVSQAKSTPKEFFKQLITKIHKKIEPYVFPIENKYFHVSIKGKIDTENICNYFEHIDTYNVRIVVCLDEFDVVRKYLKREHFGCLHAILSSCQNISFIITARRLLVNIEKEVCEDANPSTLHQLFNLTSLKPFNDKEVEDYWNRLEPFLNKQNIRLNEQYKKTAFWYSGHVPFFLDKFNDFFLRHINPNDFEAMMDGIFHDMITVLEQQDLLNPAIQIVCGPFYNCKIQSIEVLRRYGFIRMVSKSDKEELLGYSHGYSENNDNVYVCFSDYFTRRLDRIYKTRAPFWSEWEKALRLLRELLLEYIVQNAGTTWERDGTGPFQEDMKRFKQKDEEDGIPVSDCLLSYLQEKELLMIISVAWHVFEKVFGDYDRFMYKIDEILKVRNHHAHVNMSQISQRQAFLNRITQLCEEVSNMITTWNKEGDGNLEDDYLLPGYTDIVETDEKGFYHVGPYQIAKSLVKDKSLIGHQVTVTSAKFSFSNKGYLYFAKKISW